MTAPLRTPASQESFVVADCGSINTSVALFDVAAGSYRLIARASVPTTSGPPHADVSKGIQQAIGRISEITGRELLNDRGMLIRPARSAGRGVDHFAAVVSAAPPLSTLLVGLYDDVSLASARRALSGSYVYEIDSFSPADERSEQAKIRAILEQQPDLIFLVGGTDGGAEHRLMNLVETVSLGVDLLSHSKRPNVLFAGNINLRERVRHAFGDHAIVSMADNIRPDLGTETLDHATTVLGELYDKVKLNSLPGIQNVREWSSYPLVPTAYSFSTITRYLSALQKSRVLGLDLGSSSSTAIIADRNRTILTIRADLGTGRPAQGLISAIDPESVAGWMPSEMNKADIRNFVANKALNPQTVPMTGMELHLEQAVARAITEVIVDEARAKWGQSDSDGASFGLILARGGPFANTARPGQAVLMLLDAVRPTGIFSIALDEHGVLPALGALAEHDPLAVVQALEGGVLTPMGWVVAPTGRGKIGQKALSLTMQSQEIKGLEIEVAYGSLEVLPLTTGQTAEVTLRPERKFDIGFGPGQEKTVTLHGGEVGLVVDARGRPLEVEREGLARHELVRQWLWDVGG
jgi:hypothetical protein